MDAHNGKTRMGSSEVPLVVKFADAKRKEAPAYQMGLPSFKPDVWPPDQKRLTPAELAEFAAFQVSAARSWSHPDCFSWQIFGRVKGLTSGYLKASGQQKGSSDVVEMLFTEMLRSTGGWHMSFLTLVAQVGIMRE